MTAIAVDVRGLSKAYTIPSTQDVGTYRTLQEDLLSLLTRMWRGVKTARSERFWALDDVSFQIERGQAMGIVGRNGAGKSTLLKILSRITEPTCGEARLTGRVGSLLEIGAGFHFELTGRENIYLSGAVLGMRRREIAQRFADIVEFAEVERFVDTPVKHYSSGMHLRLAFSVAAHLETEILIVDEVLAVGDMSFQRKCLGKLGDVAHDGRTVLFVSHNLAALRSLCTRGILLERGRLATSGPIDEVCDQYQQAAPRGGDLPGSVLYSYSGNRRVPCHIERLELLQPNGEPAHALWTWDPVRFRFWYTSETQVRDASVVLWVRTVDGTRVLRCSTAPDQAHELHLRRGQQAIDLVFDRFPLSAGVYVLGIGLARTGVDFLFLDEEAATLTVLERDVFDSGLAPQQSWSLLVAPYRWEAPAVRFPVSEYGVGLA